MAQFHILTTLDQTLREEFRASGTERKEVLRYIRYNLVELSRDIVQCLSKQDFDSLQRSAQSLCSFAYNLEWNALAETCEALLAAAKERNIEEATSKTTELDERIKPVTQAPFRLKRRFFLK